MSAACPELSMHKEKIKHTLFFFFFYKKKPLDLEFVVNED